jgi:fructokinase
MAGFLAERAEIGDRRAVGDKHSQALPRCHRPQGTIGAEDWQGAVHAFDVKQGFAHARIVGMGPESGKGSGRIVDRKLDRGDRIRQLSLLPGAVKRLSSMSQYRIGIDLGGTKIEIALLGPDGSELVRERVDTPTGYDATLNAITGLVRAAESKLNVTASVGIGIPGVISPATGLVKNANSIALNGHTFDSDMSEALGRPVLVENDANCFALSEATDGAGAGYPVVFGVILGTGCGGGIVVHGQVIQGPNRVAGEWGHNPLPWPRPDELPGPDCWCGKNGCLETWVAGPSLARDCDGEGVRDASGIPARAASGDTKARAALARHADRLARGLAQIVNFLDPDVIILGGGLSNMTHLYDQVPRLLKRYVFSDVIETPVARNIHGDSSGVRGAAWLWPSG